MSTPKLRSSVVLGLAGGLRTFSPAVALASAGSRRPNPKLRLALGALAAGELIADKLPATPSRWSAVGLTARVACSGASGFALGGPVAALVAPTAAVASAFIGVRARTSVHGDRAKVIAALSEDVLSYTLALCAVRLAEPAGRPAGAIAPD